MAASTAGQITLVNSQGNTRTETFTMTPSAAEYVTFSSTGTTTLKTAAGGESIIGFNVNNDGVTTCTQAKIYIDGQDIRNRMLMALYAVDNAPVPTALPSAIRIGGLKEISIQMLA